MWGGSSKRMRHYSAIADFVGEFRILKGFFSDNDLNRVGWRIIQAALGRKTFIGFQERARSLAYPSPTGQVVTFLDIAMSVSY